MLILFGQIQFLTLFAFLVVSSLSIKSINISQKISVNFSLLVVDFLKIFYENPTRITNLMESLSLNISVKDFNQNLNEILIEKLLTL